MTEIGQFLLKNARKYLQLQKKSSKSCLKSRANITNSASVIVSNGSACVVGAASASTTELRDTLPKQIVREENT